MKRLIIAILGALMTAGFVVFSCVPVEDPELAPAGSSITLVGYTDAEEWTATCDGTFLVPSYCRDEFVSECASICIAMVEAGSVPDGLQEEYDECIKTSSASECAALVCDDLGGWALVCEDEATADAARTDIARSEAGCGFLYYLIDALVQGPATTTIAEGGQEVTNPLNNIEVRWTAMGGELYLPADIPGEVPPLSNPFYDKTGETGLSEIKWRIALPTACGEGMTYRIGASIGTAAASFQSDITVETAEETAEGAK